MEAAAGLWAAAETAAASGWSTEAKAEAAKGVAMGANEVGETVAGARGAAGGAALEGSEGWAEAKEVV